MFWKEELDNSGLLVRDVCAECFRNSQEDMESLAKADRVSKGPGHGGGAASPWHAGRPLEQVHDA